MHYALIMAGGAGTRLWPMSTRNKPKQLLRLIAGQSLLTLAVKRLADVVDPSRVFICTGAAYVRSITDELPGFPPEQILGEPLGRDTVNAIGFSAAILAQIDPDASMAVLTADHLIEPLDIFQRCLNAGFQTVEQNPPMLVTFGITPTYAATGFGYVYKGQSLTPTSPASHVKAFREKPDVATAREYLESGDYLWNSGMFVWKAKTILELIKEFVPENYAGIMKIARQWKSPDFQSTLLDVYPQLPKISIDYAVMEKAPQVAVIPMPVKWLDVGSWTNYAATLKADDNGNKSAGCQFVQIDSREVLAVSEDNHLIAAIGVNNLTIVHTPGATLICRSDQAENIKQMVARLQMDFGDRYI